MKGLNRFETPTVPKGFLKTLFVDAMKSVLEKAVDEIVREQSFVEGTAKEACTSIVLYNGGKP